MDRKIIAWFGMLVCCSFSFLPLGAQTPSQSLKFEERVFDFGEIQEKDGVVSHTFTFRNEGKTPVAIEYVHSGCGCVRFEYPKEPIRPDKTGEVTVFYDPSYRPGFFSKEVVVLSNNRTNYNRIWVKGMVIPCEHPIEDEYRYDYGNGLWMDLQVLLFGKIRQGERQSVKLRYTNHTDRQMDLRFVVIGGNREIKFTSPGMLEPKEKGEMILHYVREQEGEKEVTVKVYPVVNGTPVSTPIIVKAELI